MRITTEPYDSPDAVAVREDYRRELNERYGDGGAAGAPPAGEDIAAFVIARDDDGALLGGGGLYSLGQPVVEIRQMFVRSEARGRGCGAAILEALEQEAGRLGFKVVRLEAG